MDADTVPQVTDATELEHATRQLVTADPAFAPVVAASEACTLGLGPHRDSHFAVLARSICHQQLAGAAARAIHARFVALCGGRATPAAVVELGEATLRTAGLSGSKARSLVDLAVASTDGRVNLRTLHHADDETVIARLVQVRGIGRWTAEMFLMFRLGRLDVWPVDDLGVREGWGLVHGAARPTPGELRAAGDALRPVRSVAAWYAWRAVDLGRAEPSATGARARGTARALGRAVPRSGG